VSVSTLSRASWPVAVVAALLAAGAARTGGAVLPQSASVTLSSAQAGARPVVLTLVLGYEMQCGYPGPGPVTIDLPAAERVPAQLAPSQVLVDGKPAPSVAIAGHAVSVGLAPPPQVMCDVIGPGKLTIEFGRAAGLGNPSRPGVYTLEAARGSAAFTARFTIRAA